VHIFALEERSVYIPRVSFLLILSFAADFIHYRKPALCRVPGGLPSVILRALGKQASLASATRKTLGKIKHSANLLVCLVFFLHSTNKVFAKCFCFHTRQRNKFFPLLPFKQDFEAVN
jgi:hypothetical protein